MRARVELIGRSPRQTGDGTHDVASGCFFPTLVTIFCCTHTLAICDGNTQSVWRPTFSPPRPTPAPLHPPRQVCRSEMAEADMIQVEDSQPAVTAVSAETASSPLRPDPSGAAAAAVATRKSESSEGVPRGGGGGGGGGGGAGGWIGSTKLGRLELELREMRRKMPGAKAVVFSQVRGVVWLQVWGEESGRRLC